MAENKTDRQTFATKAIKSDINDAVFLGNPLIDNIISSMMAMGTEMWSMRRRMKVMESVLTSKGVTTDMLEAYVPTPDETVAWEKDRDRFIDLVYGPLSREGSLALSANFPKRS